MQYIKATKAKCEAYNAKVVQGENYSNITANWDNVKEIEGSYYIAKHPKYNTNLQLVDKLPEVDMDDLFDEEKKSSQI